MREQEYRVPRAHGPKVAVIGGGHGLSNMLRGLKQYTENISAIVTVADDGGGSGMLRQDLGMPPPGDIRSCMEALANTEPVMRELLHYRFTEGSLAGQSFGNLFLAALNGISPSFDAAVRRMSQVLAITGRVLPVTTADVQLEAEFENGATVVGESKIFYCKKQEDCRIRQVRLIPSRPKALPEAVSAIADADMIVLGPGSLYTSIIPNLLVDGIVKAIRESDALKVYVCNVMTQEGETEGYTVSDHIAAIFAHSAQGLFRLCLTNSSPIPKAVAARYAEEGAERIRCDKSACATLGVEVVFASGGGIYTSAAEAAAKVGGKLIGVDVDQSANIDTYGEGMCVTSAMKGLAETVKHMLGEVVAGNFANYGGQVETLGLVNGDDPTANYVQLPMETTQWGDGFTQDDYKALVKAMYDGDVTVSNDISAMPATTITVNFAGNIK